VKQGDLIMGYRIVSRPSNADAGKCLWAFAEKDGNAYFIKEFLDPKRPKPDSMGSVEDKQRRLAECERFEARQRRVGKALRSDDPQAGNLVLMADFFHAGTRYYKVTERIDAAAVRPDQLTADRQLILLRTLADSLGLLHRIGIVHGDLKPENILLYQPPGSSMYTAKLIDFDDSYPVGEPPPRAVVGGNPQYGAPEWLAYLRGDAGIVPTSLTQAVDMFAFGLLAHAYLYGSPPGFSAEHESPAAALLAGDRLCWHPDLAQPWSDLLPALTQVDPARRPTIDDTIAVLAGDRPPRASRVRINMSGRLSTPASTGSRVRMNFPR
jgi:serine/threonine protein kinase